jgi:hypothetical protein
VACIGVHIGRIKQKRKITNSINANLLGGTDQLSWIDIHVYMLLRHTHAYICVCVCAWMFSSALSSRWAVGFRQNAVVPSENRWTKIFQRERGIVSQVSYSRLYKKTNHFHIYGQLNICIKLWTAYMHVSKRWGCQVTNKKFLIIRVNSHKHVP